MLDLIDHFSSQLAIFIGFITAVSALVFYFRSGHRTLKKFVEKKIRRSNPFCEIQEFMGKTEKTNQQICESVNHLHKSILRLTLFSPTTSRTVHEQQLEAGSQYLDLGGNGPATVQYDYLLEDFSRRLKTKEWTY